MHTIHNGLPSLLFPTSIYTPLFLLSSSPLRPHHHRRLPSFPLRLPQQGKRVQDLAPFLVAIEREGEVGAVDRHQGQAEVVRVHLLEDRGLDGQGWRE